MTAVLVTLLSAVTIAFPKAGQRFPMVPRCYVIGATDGAETNILVNGRSVPVTRTGAWGTLVDVLPGINVIDAAGVRRTFFVACPKKAAAKKAGAAASAKTYSKLPYSGNEPKRHPVASNPSALTVVVDAGHGGSDPGAVSPHGLDEKDANLRLAREVSRELETRGYRVVMTRSDDVAVALYDRPKVAHRENAVAFISIHHNAPACDRNPLQIRYQAVYAWNSLGERLAKAINSRMACALPDVKNNGVMHANFAVTRNPEIPSCLIEADFVTSPEGEAAVWDPAHRATVAAAIADGFVDWVYAR